MKKPTDVMGIDPSIVVHRTPLLPGATPVKQKPRKTKPEWSLKITDEIAKQPEANFIEPIAHPKWLANITSVPKKDGKVRICYDYRDLNKSCPKDDFPLPHIDLLIDRMAKHEIISLTDLAAGHNQILMHTARLSGYYAKERPKNGMKNAKRPSKRSRNTSSLHLYYNLPKPRNLSSCTHLSPKKHWGQC